MKSRGELIRIVLSHESVVRRFFDRKAGSIEDAEDLVQDVMCAIIEAYPRFRGTSSVTTWVYGICKNILYSHWSKRKRSFRLLRRIQENDTGPVGHDSFYLHWAYERLHPSDRRLFTEYYRNGRKIREIAESAGKPEGTVKYQLYQLRRELKYILTGGDVSYPTPGE